MNNATVKTLGRSKRDRNIKVVELSAGKSKVVLWSHGARIQECHISDGKSVRNIVVSPPDAIANFTGAAAGRVAQLTENARFELSGKQYELNTNSGKHHLHGGLFGFHTRNWELVDLRPDVPMARFYTRIRSGEDGYPGMMEVTLTYTLREDGLLAEFRAQSSHDTLFAPSVLPFFNLSGERHIGQHFLEVPAAYFQTLSEGLPKGRPTTVKGWNDLRKCIRLETLFKGSRAKGMDQTWVTDGLPSLKHLATLSHNNGLSVQVHSTMPSVQVVTGDNLRHYGLKAWSGLSLQAGYPPNSANRVMKGRIALFAGNARKESVLFSWAKVDKQ